MANNDDKDLPVTPDGDEALEDAQDTAVKADSDDSPEADDDYKVGKGKPPLHSRFPPGKSGNPKRGPNRPPRNLRAAIQRSAYKTVEVRRNGEPVKATALEVIGERVVQEAANGKPWAVEKVDQKLEAGSRNSAEIARENKRLLKENAQLREKVEELKARRTGVLAIPGAPVNDLEHRMLYTPAHELVPYILDHVEELAEMITLKNELVRASDVDDGPPL